MDSVVLNQLIQSILPLLDAEKVLSRIAYHPDSIRQTGQTLRAFCPIHKETLIRSLSIDTTHRHFRCSYARCPGSKGGNLFDLYVLATQKDPQTALIEWQKDLGIAVTPGLAELPAAGTPAPAPAPAPAPKPAPEPIPEAVQPPPRPAAEPEPVQSAPVPPAVPPSPSGSLQQAIHDLDSVLGLEEDLDGNPVKSSQPSMTTDPIPPEVSSPLLEDISAAIDNLDEPAPAMAGSKESQGQGRPVVADTSRSTGASLSFEGQLSHAVAEMEAGNVEEALETCRDVIRRAESNEERARTRLIMGRCHLTAHRYTQAQREIKAGLESSGLHMDTEQELRYYLGLALEARRDLRSAIATLKSLVAEYGPYRDTSQIIQRIERAIQNLPQPPDNKKISFV